MVATLSVFGSKINAMRERCVCNRAVSILVSSLMTRFMVKDGT
jgi:hypothetical protein